MFCYVSVGAIIVVDVAVAGFDAGTSIVCLDPILLFEMVLQVQLLMWELLLFWEPLLLWELMLLPGFDKVVRSFFLFFVPVVYTLKT